MKLIISRTEWRRQEWVWVGRSSGKKSALYSRFRADTTIVQLLLPNCAIFLVSSTTITTHIYEYSSTMHRISSSEQGYGRFPPPPPILPLAPDPPSGPGFPVIHPQMTAKYRWDCQANKTWQEPTDPEKPKPDYQCHLFLHFSHNKSPFFSTPMVHGNSIGCSVSSFWFRVRSGYLQEHETRYPKDSHRCLC